MDAVRQPRLKRQPARAIEDLELRRSLSISDNPPNVRLAQLRSVYDAVPVGLAFVDCNERYLSINRRLAGINGADMMDHLGRSVREMVPAVYAQVGPDLRRALRGESVLGAIVVGCPHPASPAGKFLVSYEPARDEGGEVVGVSIAVLEIQAAGAQFAPLLQTILE